ncbi:MAG TPA: enoyl-CoA hydratase/isomerase family protein [Dehalococcoidales bacterium]|nr:enoyl-CoA hydratase/isomerase family protein [Dehalococcoidales bacterium]
MPYKNIELTRKDHVAGITLKQTAMNLETAQELSDVCATINGDEDVYVVIITGNGGVFCTGSLKGEILPASAIADIEKPVIAAINGDALEEGLEMTLAADIRVASSKARFGLPRVAEGKIPSDGGTQRLPRIVGRGKALEMLLTGDVLDASEALEIGLVSRVVAPDALEAETQKLAETIAAKGPIALRYTKEAVIKGMDMTLTQGLRLEADLYFLIHTTSDRTEGIKSYLEKCPPKFKNG